MTTTAEVDIQEEILYSVFLCYFMFALFDLICLFYFILFYFILFYFILFYFILFYFILFYSILFCFILFCFVLSPLFHNCCTAISLGINKAS